MLVLLLAAAVCAVLAVSQPASWPACNYKTGHGFLIVPDSTCSYFLLHHLGAARPRRTCAFLTFSRARHAAEFQCPHYWDIKVAVNVTAGKEQFCADFFAGTVSCYTVAPEFVLPEFAEGRIATVTDTPLYRGFFNNNNGSAFMTISFAVVRTVYSQAYNVFSRGANATYLFQPFGGHTGEGLLFHRVLGPPDFDQVLRATTIAPSFSSDWR